ncbi:hypothetical protein H2248_009156 [Termitomyces sp. 'cryptogamus']|nr:hypothetical protein H2248_009156 [Termitomyces sp. 'cryptogamus']
MSTENGSTVTKEAYIQLTYFNFDFCDVHHKVHFLKDHDHQLLVYITIKEAYIQLVSQLRSLMFTTKFISTGITIMLHELPSVEYSSEVKVLLSVPFATRCTRYKSWLFK